MMFPRPLTAAQTDMTVTMPSAICDCTEEPTLQVAGETVAPDWVCVWEGGRGFVANHVGTALPEQPPKTTRARSGAPTHLGAVRVEHSEQNGAADRRAYLARGCGHPMGSAPDARGESLLQQCHKRSVMP